MTDRKHGKPNVMPFDFRRPNKFNRDHVRALQLVHETFARQLSTVFATTLRSVAQVVLSSVEQVTYDEYLRALPNPSYMAILSLNPLPGAAVLQLPLPIAFTAIDRLLGGNGESASPARPLTEIESNLMRGLMDRALRELEYAYETLVHVETEIVQTEFNPQFVQIAAPSDMAIAATFETRIGETRDTASLCIPYTTMQPVLEVLASQQLFADRPQRDAEQWQRALEGAVSTVPVEAAVRFGSVTLTSREIVNLAVGDIVPLEHPVDRPLTLSVDDVPCYEAVTGRRSKKLAVLIVGDADGKSR